MRCRAYHSVSGAIFALVSLMHLVRALRAMPVHAGAWEVPLSVSWAGALGAAFLAIWAFRSQPTS